MLFMGGGGGGGGAGDGTALTSIGRVVTVAAQTEVIFSGIPSTFRDLIIRSSGRSPLAGNDFDPLQAQFNGDTGNKYYMTRDGSITNSGYHVSTGAGSSCMVGAFTAALSAAGCVGDNQCILHGYSEAGRQRNGFGWHTGQNAAKEPYGGSLFIHYDSTDVIASIRLFLGSGEAFVTGSIIQLVGVSF